MKVLLILILIVVFSNYSLCQEKSQYYSNNNKVLEELEGEWKIIYATYPTKTKPAGGRGESKVELSLGKVVAEFSNVMDFHTGLIYTKIIIGFDTDQQKYYMITYDNMNTTPVLFFGDYNNEEKKYTFFANAGNSSGEELKLKSELVFEREDKFVLTNYHLTVSDQRKMFELAFIRK